MSQEKFKRLKIFGQKMPRKILKDVPKYLEKYKNELIVIKYGGNVFIKREIFNNFMKI